MPFEDELTDALNDTAHTFQPDLTALVNAGVSDGRRRNRRRRALGVLGTVTALAVVAVGGTFASGVLSSDQHTSKSADRKPTPSATRTTPPAVPVNPAATPKPYTQKQLEAVLKSLLPKGSVTFPKDNPNFDGTFGGVTFDDGHGAAEIDVNLQQLTSGDSGADGLKCPDPAYVPNDVCTLTQLADGSHLEILKGWEYPTMKGGMKEWDAWLTTPQGGRVGISEYNSAQEKSAVTRTNPPLTSDQLKAIVTSSRWIAPLAAVPKPKSLSTQTGSPNLTSQHILGMLNSILPVGIARSQGNGQQGFADLLLNDGKGNGLFQINIQDWSAALAKSKGAGAKSGDNPVSLFAGATVLSDGSKLRTSQESGQWTADLLRTDGLRIVVMEFNAPGQNVAATRADPVLTMAQLKAVVTSPVWKK